MCLKKKEKKKKFPEVNLSVSVTSCSGWKQSGHSFIGKCHRLLQLPALYVFFLTHSWNHSWTRLTILPYGRLNYAFNQNLTGLPLYGAAVQMTYIKLKPNWVTIKTEWMWWVGCYGRIYTSSSMIMIGIKLSRCTWKLLKSGSLWVKTVQSEFYCVLCDEVNAMKGLFMTLLLVFFSNTLSKCALCFC